LTNALLATEAKNAIVAPLHAVENLIVYKKKRIMASSSGKNLILPWQLVAQK